jgi:hypothetical protein
MGLKGDRYLDAVGDLDEGNAAGHPELLTVEGHCPFNAALACALAGNNCKVQRLWLGHTANSEGPLNFKCGGTGLRNLV